MNIYISVTMKAKATKFGENVSDYCTQLKCVLEFDQAPRDLRKLKKNVLQA